MGNILAILKRKYWYILLLLLSSLYVWDNRLEIHQLEKLNAQNLIFLFWLLLLLLPLFSEMEILGVKFKKEIEQSKKEIQHSINALGTQIMNMKIDNSFSFHNVLGQLPSAAEVAQVLEENKNSLDKKQDKKMEDRLNETISEDSVYLFRVRLTLEERLREICVKFNITNSGIQLMSDFLFQKKVIKKETFLNLIHINQICNRGVHGEAIDEKYIQLVRLLLPNVLEALEKAQLELDLLNTDL